MKSRVQTNVLLRVVVVLCGLMALLIAYYWVHKPFDIQLIMALGGAVVDLLTTGALFAIAGGLGRRLLNRLDLAQLSTAETTALSAGLGLGAIALGVLILGLVGLFKGIVFGPLLIVIALLTRRDLRDWLRDCNNLVKRIWPVPTWEKTLAAFVLLLLALALLAALAPPTAWDALMYHLVGPQVYLDAGRITAHPENHFLGLPQLTEVLFALPMSITGRDTAAAPIHFGFGLVALLAIGGLTRRYTGSAAGWLAIALLFSGTSTWHLFATPYVDLAVVAYSALVLVALNQWRENRTPHWLILTGVLLGFIVSVKYTAGILALAALIAVILLEPRRTMRNGLILSGVALLVFLPWAIKGWLLYENPVYPFFFDGLNWDSLRNQAFNTELGSGLLGRDIVWQLPILPLAATIFGVEGGLDYSFTVGPWVLTLPLFLIPGWRWVPQKAKVLVWDCLRLAVPLLLIWMALAAVTGLFTQIRFMAVVFPMMTIAGAVAIDSLAQWPKKPVNLAVVVRAVLMLTFALAVIEPVQNVLQTGPLNYLTGSTSRTDYLRRNLGPYVNAVEQIAALPPGSQVQMMWEPRSYHCLRVTAQQDNGPLGSTCRPDITLDHWSYPLIQGETPATVLQNWQAEGITHLLVSDWALNFVLQDDARTQPYNALFQDAVTDAMIPVWTDGLVYTLYTWEDATGE